MKRITICFLIFLAISMQFASAAGEGIAVSIDIEPAFELGDFISFNYSISSSSEVTITYLASVSCPNAPAPLQNYKTLRLSGAPFSSMYSGVFVEESMPSQACKASVQIFDPVNVKEEREFQINTKPSFDFEVSLCMDASCLNKSKTFSLGEKVYVSYSSNVQDVSVSALLTSPDGTQSQISIPASFEPDKTGTYTLSLSASKEGYRPLERIVQFGVIEGSPSIKNLFEDAPKPDYVLTGALVVIIILAAAAAARMRRKKNSEQPSNYDFLSPPSQGA